MQHFLNILSKIALSTEKSSDKFIHSLGKVFADKMFFLISRILLQFEEQDPVIHNQQPQKPIPVIYCATSNQHHYWMG